MDFDQLLHHVKFEQTPDETEAHTLANLIRTQRDAREVFMAVIAHIEQTSQGVSSADSRAVEKMEELGYGLSLHER